MNVRVRVLVSFNGLLKGDQADVPDSPRLRGFERAGLVEVSGGTSKDRPDRPASSDPGGVDERATDRGADGGQSGEDLVSR